MSGKIRSQLVSLLILRQKKNWRRSAFRIPFPLCGFDSDHVDSFYQEPCYYLDNLCVDFRYQRLGIGSLLLQWGLEVANEKKLCVGTEASPKGHGLYLKYGFEQSGWFTVAAHGRELRMPVLKLKYPQKNHIRSE